MNDINYYDLKEIDRDLLFFFLIFISSLMALYIIYNKRNKALNKKCASDDSLNNLFRIRIYIAIIVNIYFVINAYESLEKIKKKDNYSIEEYNSQMTILIANVFILIGSFMYLSLTNSDYIISR